MANLIDQIEKENMKESVPVFSVGDTVLATPLGLMSELKKATRKEFRLLKVWLLQEKMVALEKLSLLEKFLMALVWKKPILSTHQKLQALKLSEKVSQKEQNFTMFVTSLERLPKLNQQIITKV